MNRKIFRNFNENHFFLIIVCLIFALGAFTFIKTERSSSAAENRSLSTFKHLTAQNFLDGTFQKNFENAISDQFPLGEKIRAGYGNLTSNLPTFGIYPLLCKNNYVNAVNSKDRQRATYNCEDYIVYHPSIHNMETKQKIMSKNLSRYNHANTLADTYYYYIPDSYAYDFEQNQVASDYASYLENNLKGNFHFAKLQYNNFEEFKNYFYKTDHHWNYKGSYQGFLDIANMLGIKNPIQPTATFTNHENFFGSHARVTTNYNYQEEFTVYQFNFPEHDTTLNRSTGEYGNSKKYFNHDYSYNKQTNYYAYFYGNDYGEIVFDYHQPQKDNLLIISNSFSNAVNELIAEYFNKTYVVDLRFYEKHIGQKFALSKYIKDNNIDKVLFIMDSGFLSDESLNKGLES